MKTSRFFADVCRQIRKERGFTQEQLADALGVERSVIGQWESERSAPGDDALRRLGKLLDGKPTRLVATKQILKLLGKGLSIDDIRGAIDQLELSRAA